MVDTEKLSMQLMNSAVISEFMHGICRDFSNRFGKAAFDIYSIDKSEKAYQLLELSAIEALDACKASINDMKRDGSLKAYIDSLISRKEEE